MNKLIPFILLLSGCAYNFIPDKYTPPVPENFNSHINTNQFNETKKNNMDSWWGQFQDKILLELINSAQKNSPDVATAVINLNNYKLTLVTNQARSLPKLDASASASKGILQQNFPVTTNKQLGFQSSWELDLLGKNHVLAKSSQSQLEGATAKWHEARTIVAAEVARSYFNYHFCQLSKQILEKDYQSKLQQDKITKDKIEAGFESPSSNFTSEATISQSEKNIITQKNQCEAEIKALVSLTAINEASIINKLSNYQPNFINNLIQKKDSGLYFPISVPGALIKQRPDVYNMEKQLEATGYEIGFRKADRYPSVSISGNIFKVVSESATMNTSGNSWQIGPLSITLPIFDGGVRKANEEFVVKKYEQQKIQLASSIRVAIKEVEISLNNLNATQDKLLLNKKIVEGYQKSYEAALVRYQAGLASLFELEDYRRTNLTATSEKLLNEQDRLNAWIDLYKALGGGFNDVGELNEKI